MRYSYRPSQWYFTPLSLLFRTGNLLRQLWEPSQFTPISTAKSRIPKRLYHLKRNCHPSRSLALPHLFIVIWFIFLLWGEVWKFKSSVESCEWSNWESWPTDASPHHLIFLADPQLIDPHSYPGRPWPLDWLTVIHTDNYLKRSYTWLQKKLHPDTIFFLGDLFDGGREWKTARGDFREKVWADGLRPSNERDHAQVWRKKYGEDFWLNEYDRFGRIFYKFWNLAGSEPGPWQRGRKIISSLPGNHDLGIGDNIKLAVRNRFELYFGEGNRVDIIANHTFVSIDSVSLSASESTHDTSELTTPVENFLSTVQVSKRKAIARELRHIAGNDILARHVHRVEDLANANFTNLPALDPGPDSLELPTVLLTHVPLYREPGTPCGPQRERWPPTKNSKGETVTPDERNAISISKGYQYQNVLSPSDSIKLISSIKNVRAVFSGDDHDYCEVVHSSDKNNVKEITVKSMSWAMGVRRPGFLQLSMWNPIDASGKSIETLSNYNSASQTPSTMQSHLCLLPDQIGIYIHYLFLLILTIVTLIIRAILTPVLNLTPFSSEDRNWDLPNTKKQYWQELDNFSRSSASASSNRGINLAPRYSAIKMKNESHTNEYRKLNYAKTQFVPTPLFSASNNPIKYKRKLTKNRIIFKEAWTSIWRVTWIVLLAYIYLFNFF
ncbi:hypothetical protein K3495_g6535 [Podosphaera aphanis]|nr:hypothetical protein K3495_g6535 [Podosphaera aphanis]